MSSRIKYKMNSDLLLGLLLAAILTIVIESAVYWVRGYRDKDFYLVVLFINIATNLSLNLFGSIIAFNFLFRNGFDSILLILILEIGIYFIELIPLSKMTENKKRIRYSVLIANLTSMILGSLLLYIIQYII